MREDIYTAGEEGMMRDKPRRRDRKRRREEGQDEEGHAEEEGQEKEEEAAASNANKDTGVSSPNKGTAGKQARKE